MEISFREFMRNLIMENYPDMVEESIESRINELADSGIFTNLGEEYIRGKFDEYQNQEVVPLQIRNFSDKSGGNKPTTDKQLEELLYYVFKFVDKDVQMDLMKLPSSNDPKIRKKIEKHYSGLNTRPAVEDSSTISSTLGNYLALRNKPKLGLPKSLRQKEDFQKLASMTAKAVEEATTITPTDDSSGGDFMPKGMKLVAESGDLQLIQWHTDFPDDRVCDLPEDKLSQFSSMRKDMSGKIETDWCVFYSTGSDYLNQYAEVDSSTGVLKYPMYLVRKGKKPYALLHGKSLQAKQAKSGEPPITQEQADEIWEALLSKSASTVVSEGILAEAEGGKNWLEEILKDHI